MDEELIEREFDDLEALAMDDYEGFKKILGHAREDLENVGMPGRFAEAETLYEDDRGFLDKAADFLMDKFLPEVGEMLEQKFHEGENEIAKALFGHSDAFVLYGHQSLQPVEPQSYEDLLKEASQRAAPEQERQQEMEM